MVHHAMNKQNVAALKRASVAVGSANMAVCSSDR